MVRPSQSRRPENRSAIFAPLAVALALGVLAMAVPQTASATKLYVSWTSQNASCRSEDEDMYACLLGATQFQQMILQYPQSVPLEWGGGAVVDNCADRDWGCVVRAAGWDVKQDDVVVQLTDGSCAGRNAGPNSALWPYMVHTANGDVRVRGASLGDVTGSGMNCHCHQALGMHEIYEAATDSGSADCCNGQNPTGCGQFNCAACASSCQRYAGGGCGDGSLGWYLFSCPSGDFRAQLISPVSDEYGADSCTALTVDSNALCAQPRAQREPWRCVDGNLTRCVVTLEVQDCAGRGCDESPTPHCLAGAGMDAGGDAAGDGGAADGAARDSGVVATDVADASDDSDAGSDAGGIDAGMTVAAGGCGCAVPRGAGRRGSAVAAAMLCVMGAVRRRRRAPSALYAGPLRTVRA